MQNLDGKTDIVTGGASGIGEATALLYAENGCNVVISDLNDERATGLQNKLNNQAAKLFLLRLM